MANGYDFFRGAANSALDGRAWTPILSGDWPATGANSLVLDGNGGCRPDAAIAVYQHPWPLASATDWVGINVLNYSTGILSGAALALWIQADGGYYDISLETGDGTNWHVVMYRLPGTSATPVTLQSSISVNAPATNQIVGMRARAAKADGSLWQIQLNYVGAGWYDLAWVADASPLTSSTAAGMRIIQSNGTLGNSTGLHVTGYWQGLLDFDATDVTVSGQAATILTPTALKTTDAATLVLYNHGVGDSNLGLYYPTIASAIATSLSAGYIWAGSAASGDNFGNDTSLTDYQNLYDYVIARYNVTQVIIVSGSMGGLSGLLNISNNSHIANIKGWYGAMPMTNLAYADSPETFDAGILAAYGVGSYASVPSGHDPNLKTANQLTRTGVVRFRFSASTSDTTVHKANHTDLLQAIVAGTAPESGIYAATGAHGDKSHWPASDFLSFFDRCSGRVAAAPVAVAKVFATSGSY